MHTLANVVIPVFGVILAGYLSGHFGILGGASSEALNKFVYYFALPPLLFVSTARAPIGEVFNWPFIGAYMFGTVATLLVTLIGSRLLLGVRGVPSLALHGMASVFSNAGYMGIPLFIAAFGADRTLPAVVATMSGTLVVIGAAILVFELSTRPPTANGRGAIVLDIGRTLWRNPILVAPFVGAFLGGTGIGLPDPLARFLDLLGAAAAPAALFAIGLSLFGRSLAGQFLEVGWIALLKLLVQPFFTWLLVRYVFHLDPFWGKSAVLLAALPVGALVFVVSQRFDVRVATSSAAIIVTTALSVVTLWGLLVVLGVG